MSEALAYDGQVVSGSALDLPGPSSTSACASVRKDSAVRSQMLESLITVTDYSELRSTLIQLLKRYRDVFAQPGEPLDATDKAEHHIKLKPASNPVYIPAYRLPHRGKWLKNTVTVEFTIVLGSEEK